MSVLALCGELVDLAQPPSSTEQALTLMRQASRRLVAFDTATQKDIAGMIVSYIEKRIAGSASSRTRTRTRGRG